jgi:hypothetical protein
MLAFGNCHALHLPVFIALAASTYASFSLIFEEQDPEHARKAERGKNNDKSSLSKCGELYLAQLRHTYSLSLVYSACTINLRYSLGIGTDRTRPSLPLLWAVP